MLQFHEILFIFPGHEYDCDKRLRHKDNDPLDLDDNSKKNSRKYTTADVVTEAIQRIDNPASATSGGMISGTGNKKSGLLNNSNNFCDNNTTKCPSTNNIKSEANNSKKSQRQRHASSKKSRKNKQQTTTCSTGTGSSTSGFSPPTIFPSNVPEMDLYLNSAASNVSPDSGIQSEGTAGANNSSPLHLHTGSSTSTGNGIPGSTAGMSSEMATLQTQSFQVIFFV